MSTEVIREGADAFVIVSRTRYERAGLCPGCARELWTQVDEGDGTTSGKYLIWCAEPLIMQPHYGGTCVQTMPLDIVETLPGQLALDDLPAHMREWGWGDAPGGA